jgi:hypothetical protein
MTPPSYKKPNAASRRGTCYQIATKTQVLDEVTRSLATLVRKRLYIRDRKRIMALELGL